jgi:hypothetical protein
VVRCSPEDKDKLIEELYGYFAESEETELPE